MTRFTIAPHDDAERPFAVVDSWRERAPATYTRRDYAARRARADNLASVEAVATLARGVAAYQRPASPAPAVSLLA